MRFASGARLGPFEILNPLGAGGWAKCIGQSKTLKEVAEQYTFMFKLFAGITLTPQDEADIVAFLRLL